MFIIFGIPGMFGIPWNPFICGAGPLFWRGIWKSSGLLILTVWSSIIVLDCKEFREMDLDLRCSDVIFSMSISAFWSSFACTLSEGLAQGGLEEFRGESELNISMGVRTFVTHLTISNGVLLTQFCLFQIWSISELSLTVCERTLLSFSAMSLT